MKKKSEKKVLYIGMNEIKLLDMLKVSTSGKEINGICFNFHAIFFFFFGRKVFIIITDNIIYRNYNACSVQL